MDSADILYQHPNNLTINEGSVTHTDKKWAKELRGISREQLRLHTQRLPDGSHVQDWSALHPETYDDFLRRGERSVQPNARHCHNLNSEADGLAYFKLEIAAPVLSKFIRYPALSCNAEASTGRGGLITDELYKFNGKHAVMVEGKRNLFEADLWFKGKFDKRDDQVKLCRELRGYAMNFECPHVALFDNAYLVLLQFRAFGLSQLDNCDVDCWILERVESGSQISRHPLRDGFYKIASQAVKRCVCLDSPRSGSLGNFRFSSRSFYSGLPLWDLGDGRASDQHPEGYYRAVDELSGCFCWKFGENWVLDRYGQKIADSGSLWTPRQTQWETTEDLYSAT